MKKIYRVKSEKEFQTVFRQGKSTANRQLVVYVYPKEAQTHFRIGLSVGKKIGNAVKRNRIKRYLRQAVQEWESLIEPSIDCLLIARPDICDKSYEEVKQSVLHVMKLAKLIQQSDISGGKHEK